MSEELRAATEIDRHTACEAYMQSDHVTIDRELWGQCQRVASAWLAANPTDDAEPVSGDFLRSVGFLPDDAGVELVITLHDWSDLEDGLHLLIHPESGQATLEEYDQNGEHVAAVLLPACPTCGDVRRLCAGLRIELGKVAQ